MLELTLGEVIAIIATAFGIPTAFTGICVWQLKRKIEKREKIEEEREKAREQNELFMIKGTSAAIALGEATARGVASNHGDPEHLWKGLKLGYTMDGFRKDVKAAMGGTASTQEPAQKTIYRVQCGAYAVKANANMLAAQLEKKGFDTYIVVVGKLYKVQTGAYSVKANADKQMAKVKAAGFDAFITTEAGKPAASSTPAKPATIAVGDKVKCNAGVTKFSNGAKMAAWVPTATLYVRKIESGGKILLVSTEKTKAVYTGRVNASDVHKI